MHALVAVYLHLRHTCICADLVASVFDDMPVLSIAVSVVVTTALLALLYRPLKSRWEDAAPQPSSTT